MAEALPPVPPAPSECKVAVQSNRTAVGWKYAPPGSRPRLDLGSTVTTTRGLLQLELTPLLWAEVRGEDVAVPKKFPPEFKRDVVRVARRGDLSQAEVAADFDISVESVRRWLRQADIDDGIVDGQTSRAERAEQERIARGHRVTARVTCSPRVAPPA